MAEVTLKSLTKIFEGTVVAVKEFDLKVEDKEFLVLVGPSGCGKSTTLRCIAGLEEITEGEIFIGGRLVNDIPPKDRDIAMVFQNYALYPHMNVYKNLSFGLELRKMKKDEIERRVHEAAQILDIEHLLDRKPKALSGGQRQRVAVGRAIVRKPKVFLFDEPLSNLDAKLRVQMRTEIAKLHQNLQATIIYVTHDQVEAMTMGTKIVVMKDGIIQQVSDPLTLYDKPVNKFVAGFIGSPPMNFIDTDVVKEGADYHIQTDSFKVQIEKDKYDKVKDYAGKKVTFGFRPSDLIDESIAKDKAGRYIKAKVEVIEPLGSEIFLYMSAGKDNFVARVPHQFRTKIGDEVGFTVDMDKSHVFDIDTEMAIF
ncbi:MAG: sn-glycerol-3-phosphate ABC transporter ATP-binding protein UgpC [Spirochaetota bacterium]|nr:MAG: sn-glycerol-3-phosphate ABC transporter ATP-binding protein UgpC [Spirochaetota bacterium]